MPRALWTLVAAIAYAATSDAASHHVDVDFSLLQPGEYRRPHLPEGSGKKGAKTPDRRSPCPAVNTMANHGFLPRNGQNITKEILKFATMFFFNLDDVAAQGMVAHLPNGLFSLDIMATGLPAHDASFFRQDDYYDVDPIVVDKNLAHDFLKRADSNGKIDTSAVALARKDLALTCEKKNPECKFGPTEKAIAFKQAALILVAMGDGDFIYKEDARFFFLLERFPSNFGKSPKPISNKDLDRKAAELIKLAD